MEYKGLPVFEAKMNGEATGIYAIALVDIPATDSNFMAFGKENELLKYSVQSEEKRVVFGVLMRANYPLYRRDERGEYYVYYSPETIRVMAEKLMADNNHNKINYMHAKYFPGGVKCVQIFIKDSAKGISPAGFEDIEDGSLFGEFHVEDDETWALIKDGTFKGFSLEGVWAFERFKKEEKQTKNNKMSKIKQALRKLLEQFGSIETDGGILDYEAEELAVGVDVTIEGNPAPDGEYVTEDKVIVVADGKVAEIRDKEVPVEEEVIEVEAEEETPVEEVADEVEEVVDEVADAAEEVAEAAEEGRDFAAEIDALMARIAELEAKIAELTGKDTEPTIEETFQKQTKGLSKAERMAAFLKN